MKKSLVLSGLCLSALLFSSLGSLADEWSSDFSKSMEKAKTEKKMVLLDFTGSDWCGWCMKLHAEVFSKPKFKSYAKDKLVLVEVDFPQNKHLTRKVTQQNADLAKQYGISGYPTIIVLNSEGKKVGQLGYMEGGPDAFVAELDKLPKS
jgi:thioredoxin-related protein